jgi:nucleoid-associated protein YgaU
VNGADSALGTAAGWAAATVAGYLALGLLAGAVERLGGPAARCATALLAAYPPAARVALRAAVAATLGLGAAVAGATPASASALDGTRHTTRPPLVASAVGLEPLDWPVRLPAAAPTVHPPAAAPTRDAPHQDATAPLEAAPTVVVRRGDCLWSIAAASLGPGATTNAVATVWPQWWAANRHAIGDDPALLRPGLRLHPPAASERSPR